MAQAHQETQNPGQASIEIRRNLQGIIAADDREPVAIDPSVAEHASDLVRPLGVLSVAGEVGHVQEEFTISREAVASGVAYPPSLPPHGDGRQLGEV